MSSIKELINKMPEKQLDDFAKSVQEVQEGNPSPSINGSGSEDTPEIKAAKARVDTLNAEGSTATEEEKAAAQKALDDLLAASKIPGENAASGENVDAGAVDSEKSGENALPGADAIDPENARTQKQEQIKSLEEKLKSMDDGEEKAKIEAEIDKLKEEIKAIVGGRRRTRRHNKKGDKKSRRQSKKGGKKHRKSAKKGSSKSKRSRRYSSRK
jgi:hypothetical protein